MSNTLNRRAVAALRTPREPSVDATPHVIVHPTQPVASPIEGEWDRTHARLTAWKAHAHLFEARRLLQEGSTHACAGSSLAEQFAVATDALMVASAALEEVGRLGRTVACPSDERPGPDGA